MSMLPSHLRRPGKHTQKKIGFRPFFPLLERALFSRQNRRPRCSCDFSSPAVLYKRRLSIANHFPLEEMHSSLFRKHLNDRYFSLPNNLDSSSTTSSCPSTPPMSATWLEPPAIELCLMNENHRDQVSDLVVDSFFRDEPLNKCLAFDIPTEPIEFTELILSLALRDQCSFVAIDVQTQKVVGVIC